MKDEAGETAMLRVRLAKGSECGESSEVNAMVQLAGRTDAFSILVSTSSDD